MYGVKYLTCGCKVTFAGFGKVLCLAHWIMEQACEVLVI